MSCRCLLYLFILNYFSGVFCSYKIPENTFFDEEDGDTRRLNLTVHSMDDSIRQWIYLDDQQHHLIGIGLDVGAFNYRLEARDSVDQMISTAFEVRVVDDTTTSTSRNHLFSVTLEQSSDQLLNDPMTIVTFVHRLANAVASDRDASHISLNVIRTNPATIEWYNNTLSTTVCQRGIINSLKSTMLTKRGGHLKKEFVRAMNHQYHVKNVTLTLSGSCANESTVDTTDIDVQPKTTESDASISDDLLLSAILPIAIIVVLLILAILIACCLYKRQHSYKLAENKEAKSSYVSKGLPVMFPEEVPNSSNELATVTTPMLVKEERPPLASPIGVSSFIGRDQRDTSMPASTTTTEHENPLYKPPQAPIITSGSSPRPPAAISRQHQPPPYVPP